ncbi:MAG: response regulator, partial [Sulfuricellaceae bacterium]|nr:response regulator [Sulfuricellaceae bacterium]
MDKPAQLKNRARLPGRPIENFPQRMRQIEQAWLDCQADSASCGDLLRGVRELLGACSCPETGTAAAQLEEALRSALGPSGRLSAGRRARVDSCLAVLGASGQADAPAATDSPAPRPSGDEKSLFLLDDDAPYAERFARRAGEHGYAVEVFASGVELVRALARSRPTAIVLDAVLAQELLQRGQIAPGLKLDDGPPIPVVFSGKRGDFEARLEAVRAGASHYLDKSSDIGTLLRQLDEIADRHADDPYRVLIVENDAELSADYRACLEAAGMDVETLADPFKALASVRRFAPDLVLLDVHLPQCNGLELAAVIRQQEEYDSIPIVFLTDEPESMVRLAAMNLGGDDILGKPITARYLVAAVKARIKRARQLRHGAAEVRQTLRELEQLKYALDKHATVSMTDASGAIIYANDHFCESSGYSREELIGKNHRLVKSGEHPAELYQRMWAKISKGQVWQGV